MTTGTPEISEAALNHGDFRAAVLLSYAGPDPQPASQADHPAGASAAGPSFGELDNFAAV